MSSDVSSARRGRVVFTLGAQACLVFLTWMSAGVAVASAQTTVHLAFPGSVNCQSACSGQILSIDPDSGAPPRIRTMPSTVGTHLGSVFASGDGGLMLWTGAHSVGHAPTLNLLDLATGTPFPGVVSPLYEFLGHPSRLEVYAADLQGLFALSASGVRRFADLSCGGFAARPIAISGDGRRVAFRCLQSDVIYDTTSGAPLRTFAQPSIGLLSPGGEWYYTIDVTQRLHRFDVGTGADMAQVDLGPVPGAVVADPRTGDLYELHRNGAVSVHDGMTLQVTRTGTIAGQLETVDQWTFERYRARAVVSSFQSDSLGILMSYAIVDLNTLAQVAAVTIRPAPGDSPARFALTYRPSAPLLLASTVNGSSVQLSWSAAMSAGTPTRYVVEAGTAPGLSNIINGLDVGLQTTFGASGVPPGTYYVRVRAANVEGPGAPSNEIVVQVP